MKNIRFKFALILVLAVVAAVLAYPREDVVLKKIGLKNAKLQVRQGLDLQGGAHLVYQADLSKTASGDRTTAVNGLVDVIQRRVNPAGTSEINVQQSGSDRVIVELPGVTNLTDAINTIGKTAQLTFLEQTSAQVEPIATDLTGKDFKSATADIDTTTSQPIISFEFKSDAVKKFADLTTRINQEQGRLVIMLDQDILFNGTVSQPITDGHGQMQGFNDIQVAKKTAVLLNAGALPVPISLVEQRTVGATLGQESVQKSLVAGMIGLLIVALFMLLYYRLAGLVAVSALAIYTVLTLTIYKLSVFTPYAITLTLAGIAGFILSIGMAVDANILIFERMKEEVRTGKSLTASIEAGFERAWTSIRDSNVSTLITCVILYVFGTSALIKGFAVTLGLGVVISMFTAVVVSRTFLRMLIRTKVGHKGHWYALPQEDIA
ncbi:MAG TPA: protein translocase subunit SecD [Candidatus Nanoarchaeia archaeon]|nr:protein translocase subunit SecD [Candidatus Nanoarchaeia archaeon]